MALSVVMVITIPQMGDDEKGPMLSSLAISASLQLNVVTAPNGSFLLLFPYPNYQSLTDEVLAVFSIHPNAQIRSYS